MTMARDLEQWQPCPAWLLAVIVIVAAILASPGPAQADEKQIVVLPFKGPRSNVIHDALVDELARTALIVRASRLVEQLDGADPATVDIYKLANAAREVGAQGVITGQVTRRKGWYILALTLISAADGKIVREFRVELGRKPALSDRAQRLFQREFLPTLDELEAASGGSGTGTTDGGDRRDGQKNGADQGGDKGSRGARVSAGTSGGSGNRTGDSGTGSGNRPDRSGSGSGSGTSAETSRSERLGPGRSLDVAMGMSVLGRRLSFDAADIGLAPFEYSGLPMPAARIHGTLYPFGLAGAGGFLGNVGASLVYERIVLVNSTVDGNAVSIPTRHQRLGVGVHYRLDLGDAGTSPALTFGAGYDQITFALDRDVLMDDVVDVDLPDVDYLAFYPTVGAELPLGSRLALYTQLAYLIISDAGPIENENNYGSASASGLDGELGAELRLPKGVLVRIGAEYTRISHSFQGDGELRDRDGDGTPDVEGAQDLYFGGYLMAGFRF